VTALEAFTVNTLVRNLIWFTVAVGTALLATAVISLAST
jgi:hypothetical protein